jgi:hypothetical protein
MTPGRRSTTTAQRVAAVVVGVLVAVPLALAALLATAGPAEAATYRYWTYWWGGETGKAKPGWTFAKVGPAGHTVQDTWVLGWRFATSRSTTGSAPPRQSSDFATLCPRLAPVAGSVRVALVIDYGTAADAPPGQGPPTTSSVRVECLTIAGTPKGTDVLRDATPPVRVRSENGLICALDGYPRNECAPVVADPAPTPTATRTRAPSATSTPGAPRARSTPAPSSSSAVTSSAAGLPTTGATAASTTATASPSVSSSTTSSGTAAADPGESDLPAVAGAPASSEQPTGNPVGLAVGGVVIAAIAGSAWLTSRRRAPR